MKKLLLTFALLALCSLAKKDNEREIGAECTIDEQCASECCSNDRDYADKGKCTYIDDDSRCHNRKKLYRVALSVYLILFTALIVGCSLLKRSQN